MLAGVALLRRAARSSYQFELQVWALTAPHSDKKIPPPQIPPILKDIIRGDP